MVALSLTISIITLSANDLQTRLLKTEFVRVNKKEDSALCYLKKPIFNIKTQMLEI